MRKIADIIATGQRVAEINKFCQRQADSACNMHANAYFISDSQSSGGSRSLGPGGDSRNSQILGFKKKIKISNYLPFSNFSNWFNRRNRENNQFNSRMSSTRWP